VRRTFFRLPLLLLAATVSSSCSQAETPTGDSARGKIRSKAEQCQECHGEAGVGASDHYPKLAGQWAAYLRKQLHDFLSGARKSEIMTNMASGLSQQDIVDIAAYFSGAPRWDAEQDALDPVGRYLFENGDPSRDLPACASCHGAHGSGNAEGATAIPAIGGQRQTYLTSQLHLWKVEDRQNSPGDVMNAVAKKLSDGEIEDLARFLSGQRPDR
jgi:cytochrome c553